MQRLGVVPRLFPLVENGEKIHNTVEGDPHCAWLFALRL